MGKKLPVYPSLPPPPPFGSDFIRVASHKGNLGVGQDGLGAFLAAAQRGSERLAPPPSRVDLGRHRRGNRRLNHRKGATATSCDEYGRWKSAIGRQALCSLDHYSPTHPNTHKGQEQISNLFQSRPCSGGLRVGRRRRPIAVRATRHRLGTYRHAGGGPRPDLRLQKRVQTSRMSHSKPRSRKQRRHIGEKRKQNNNIQHPTTTTTTTDKQLQFILAMQPNLGTSRGRRLRVGRRRRRRGRHHVGRAELPRVVAGLAPKDAQGVVHRKASHARQACSR